MYMNKYIHIYMNIYTYIYVHIFMGFFFVMSPAPAIVTGVDCVSCDIGGWAAFGREIGPLQGLIIRLSYFLRQQPSGPTHIIVGMSIWVDGDVV